MSLRGAWGALFSAVCVVLLAGDMAVELTIAPGASVGALTVLPVAAAAWLLPGRSATLVVVLALLERVADVRIGLEWVTGFSEALMLVTVALAVRLAARFLATWREAEERLRLQGQRVALLAERERIGTELNSSTVRVLFDATLHLQAAISTLPEGRPRQRAQAAIGEIDDLIAKLRAQVFSGPDAREAPAEPPGDPTTPSE